MKRVSGVANERCAPAHSNGAAVIDHSHAGNEALDRPSH